MPGQRGFSLVEMVMVMLTLAIIAMIAVPRMSRAATDATATSVITNIRVMQNAIDVYAAEHFNHDPTQDADGTVNTSAARFTARLTGYTDDAGQAGGIYGPYLIRVPKNPVNRLDTVRIDGPAPGGNLAGWRYNSTTDRILPDHLDEATAVALIKKRLDAAGARVLAGLP